MQVRVFLSDFNYLNFHPPEGSEGERGRGKNKGHFSETKFFRKCGWKEGIQFQGHAETLNPCCHSTYRDIFDCQMKNTKKEKKDLSTEMLEEHTLD